MITVSQFAETEPSESDDGLPIFSDCTYCEENDFTTALNECDGINVLQLNIHGLFSKIDYLKELLSTLNNVRNQIDIIMLNKTWGKKEQEPLCHLDGYKSYFRHRTSKKGGGIVIYYKSELEVDIIDNCDKFHEDCNFELLFVKVTSTKLKQHKNLICGCIYRSPNSSETDFLNNYEKLLTVLKKVSNKIIIGGDFNLDFIKSYTH